MANQVVQAQPKRKKDWITPVAIVGGIGAVGVGLWYYFRKTAGGAITDIWVNKGSYSKQAIPFTTNADEQTFEVGICYKNTGKEAVVLGAEVVVTKPNGEKVQPTVDMAGADVGEVLAKEYNISRVDQVGQWAIDIRIITEKGAVLDEFSGVCLDVVEQVEEGEWGQTGVVLSKLDFSVTVAPGVPGDWFPPEAELQRVAFNVSVIAAEPGDWVGPNIEMGKVTFSVEIMPSGDGGEPGAATPEIETEPAHNVTESSATLTMELVDEGYCSGAYCYIEYGKTTGYGSKTSTVRLQPGWEESFDIEGLEPDTKYYFRAVAEGRCVTPKLVGYSSRRNFTTEEEAPAGFSLRLTGAPSNAKYWAVPILRWETGEEAELWPPIPIGSTWHYEGEVPSSRVDMLIGCFEKSTGGAYVKSVRWQYIFRLYAGRDYVCDLSDISEHWWEG
jgi:hypothetical protein